MFLPRIIHRVWIGSMPTEEQLETLIYSRLFIQGSVELWLWTTSSIASRFQRNHQFMNNIVIRNINTIWLHPFARGLPVAQLHAVFERESRGAFHNNAAASDVARLLILYCYGGIYLDMDVYFKTPDYCLFSDLTDIGERLGVLQRDSDGMGNGVLVSKVQSKTVKICLEKIKELYCSGASGDLSWNIKRGYGAMRMYLTTKMSGPQVILDVLSPEQLYPIKEGKYFERIDACGGSYTRKPQLMRWNSVPGGER